MYIKRKKQGCTNTYFLRLETSNHGKGLCENEGALFQNVIHAFYKKFGYPYNEAFVENINLDDYQPSIETIQKELA